MRLLLASKSPRRAQLLQYLGIEPVLVHQDIAENFPDTLPLEEVPAYLAEQKAAAALHYLSQEGDVLLASDTIVLMEGEIFHKPTDFADGQRILQRLQGKTHAVITGVCMQSKDKKHICSDTTLVTFAPMTGAEIDYYLHKYRPYDKAGAYAVQEWIGAAKIQRMEGSYATVMGLPTQLVYAALREIWGWNLL